DIFKLIVERNIFDSNRRAARRGRDGDEEAPPKRTESFTLVGTLVYEKGPYAFFDGASSDYRKVLELGKNIAGYKFKSISGDTVKLEAGTNTVELHVGMQMKREEDGEWQPSGGRSAQTSSSSSSSSTSGESAPGDDSDIIKRLMKQREEELK